MAADREAPRATALCRAAARLPVVAATLAGALLVAVPAGRARAGEAQAAEPGRIEVARQATVEGATVRLEDLGELSGGARVFADLEIAAAPEPGETTRLPGLSLLRQLRAAGLDEKAIVYAIPSSVRVARAFQELSEIEVRDAVERRAAGALGEGESIESVELPHATRVPVGAYSLRVEEPRPSGAGRMHADVKVEQDGRVVAAVPVQIVLASVGPVVVARRPVSRGSILRAEDVDVEERRLSNVTDTALRDPAEAIGKQARVALATGRPITLQALSSSPVVKKGDGVRLVIETPTMRLTAAGEALESAAIGERVRVRNPSSKKEMTGEVVAHGLVVVAR